MNQLLYEDTKYMKEQRYLTARFHNVVNKLVLPWFKSGSIDSSIKTKPTCYNGRVPYIYGLPKVDKYGNPLRPIISNIGSLTCNLNFFQSEFRVNLASK